MADETLNKGPEGEKLPESPAPDGPGAPPAPEQAEQVTLPGMGEGGPAPSGKVINLSDVRGDDDKGGKAPAVEAEKPEKRRGRPPKEQAEPKSPKAEKTAKPRAGRPPKGDKAARAEAQPSTRDKVSQSKKKTPEKGSGGMGPPKSPPKGKAGPVKAAFHTFREHPYKVQDDKAMDDLVGTIKEHGVMTPATVRPEKDGQGYEIIAGHRRHHGSERAGLDEMPCIVRNMADFEAVREMRNSNKQRGEPLPSELARLLDLEVEAIKHQGARPGNSQEEQALGKRSVEIVGADHDMNYKKVMRYIRLNSLVPELLDMTDAKKLGFMPAVELSYIRPENQRLIAVSIEGEQSSPSVNQAKRLRELDKEGKLNGDVIDGILSEEKKEDRGVIISTSELSKYFGKEVTPAKMKEQIMALLDDWKEKQPPELAKPEKKNTLEK